VLNGFLGSPVSSNAQEKVIASRSSLLGSMEASTFFLAVSSISGDGHLPFFRGPCSATFSTGASS